VYVPNIAGADRGNIAAVMSGNRSYINIQGCAVENNVASFATITVRSNGTRFEDNGIGCQIGGGFVGRAAGAANSNTTVFEAHGSDFSNNTRMQFFNNTGPIFTEFGGLLVAGGHTLAYANATSDNSVIVRLWGFGIWKSGRRF